MKYKGIVRITAEHADGTKQVDEFDNLITDAGLNHLRDSLTGDDAEAAIKYLVIGTSTTAPAAGDVKLGSEQFRKAITTAGEDGTGRAETITYVAPFEAVFHIKELGWYAGASASTSVDSGSLIARVLYDRDKTNLESLQIERIDIIERST